MRVQKDVDGTVVENETRMVVGCFGQKANGIGHELCHAPVCGAILAVQLAVLHTP